MSTMHAGTYVQASMGQLGSAQSGHFTCFCVSHEGDKNRKDTLKVEYVIQIG